MKNFTLTRSKFIVSGVAAAALFLSPLALTLSNARPAVAAPVSPEAATGTWGVDKPHSNINFTVTHLGVSKVHGRFNDFDGSVVADGKKPQNSSVNFTIQVASIDTDQPQRDAHLKSADFFDAEKYPTITFKSSRIVKKGKGFTAFGTLTIHGVSKEVALPFTVSGPIKGPDGALHMGVDTGITIDRTAYGLTWNKLVEGTAMVSTDVDIAISLDLAKK